MAKKLPADVDELVQRAGTETPAREHRYVYGDTPGSTRPQYAIRPNKKAVGRKVSTFYLIVVLFSLGVGIVAYINNIIVVNRLAAENNQLQTQYDKVTNTNAVLKAEINRKSGWERIGKIAGEQVGLHYAKEQPELFDVDEALMNQARERVATSKKAGKPQ
jgi:cell division protein FtsL